MGRSQLDFLGDILLATTLLQAKMTNEDPMAESGRVGEKLGMTSGANYEVDMGEDRGREPGT